MTRRMVVVLGLGSVAVIGLVAGLVRWSGSGGDPDTSGARGERRIAPTPAEFAGDAYATRTLAIGDQTWDAESELTLVEIDVTPPDGTAEVQVSMDPGLPGPWLPVGSAPARFDLATAHHGFQMAYARFRDGGGRLLGTDTVGFLVDGHDAGSSSPPEVRSVGLLSPTEIVVRYDEGRIELGSIRPYQLDGRPRPEEPGQRHDPITDGSGETVGRPVSTRQDLVRTVDRFVGTRLDVEAVLDGDWTIRSETDSRYQQAAEVSDVQIMSRPLGGGLDETREQFWTREHDVVFDVPLPLRSGHRYVLESTGRGLETVQFDFDQARTVSPSIRVNQVGYAPGDNPKLAYLGPSAADAGDLAWMDAAGVPAANATTGTGPSAERADDRRTRFEVHNVATGQVVHSAPLPAPTSGRTGVETDEVTVELDFTAVGEPGRYRVCVNGLGCSMAFDIDDGVWRLMATQVARSAYHQRSGIELGPPHTAVQRPRGYHPDDGETVEASEYSLLDGRRDPDSLFSDLPAGGTGEHVPDAWGGHFDAGDWDRRIDHLHYTAVVAELVRHHPDSFDSLRLNIPESDDPVPDLLDEGLWSLDLYRRMQLPDGSIRGGIEASEHPLYGSTSWTDDLAVFAYAPDPWSSYLYAGTAAQVAHTLRPYDRSAADDYLQSALAAMEWAEDTMSEPAAGRFADDADDGGADLAAMIEGQRNVAAAALLLATGDARWNRLFLDTIGDPPDAGEGLLECHVHTVCDAAWLYLEAAGMIGPSGTGSHAEIGGATAADGTAAQVDLDLAGQLRDWFLATGDRLVSAAEGNAYGWTSEHPDVPLIWGLGAGGSPKAIALLRAFQISGDERFRRTVVRSASFSLGANPLNQVFLTGIGQRPVRHPLIVDTLHGAIPVWPGTPVYGLHDLGHGDGDDWAVQYFLEPGGARPDPDRLPYLRQWYDLNSLAFFNEFTLHQSHAEALRVFASLHASR